MSNLKKTWDIYSQSWKNQKLSDRLALFEQSLDPDCCYTDPLTTTNGWDQLVECMEGFHRQVPNGYFENTDFLSHHNFSIAKWDMKNGDGQKIGEGYSFAEYNKNGKLLKMTGLYKLPE